MKTILRQTETTLRERGSKFLGFLFPCADESEFDNELALLKSKFPDASHHCYGYRIDPNLTREFSSDDGEPSGTAGLPILNQLKSFEVINAGVVVVRYFGGTKLGKSGLIESYGECARLCLEEATLQEIVPVQLFKISYPYPAENIINKLRLNYNLVEQVSEYLEAVSITFACETEKSLHLEKELKGYAHLNIEFEKLETSFIATQQ